MTVLRRVRFIESLGNAGSISQCQVMFRQREVDCVFLALIAQLCGADEGLIVGREAVLLQSGLSLLE